MVGDRAAGRDRRTRDRASPRRTARAPVERSLVARPAARGAAGVDPLGNDDAEEPDVAAGRPSRRGRPCARGAGGAVAGVTVPRRQLPRVRASLARDAPRPVEALALVYEAGARGGEDHETVSGLARLRHTALTHEAAVNPAAYVQMRAGHSNGSITERYVHAAQVGFPGAAERGEARIFAAVGGP